MTDERDHLQLHHRHRDHLHQHQHPNSSIKRKRVTKACLVCAKSRRKCDGTPPECGTCRAQGSTCAWSDIPTRRGPPKGYKSGAADPQSLVPKLEKIKEHIKGLQVAYGEKLVMDELELCLFGSILHGKAWHDNNGEGSSVGTKEEIKTNDSDFDPDDHASSDVDEGSSSGLMFLAASMQMRDYQQHPHRTRLGINPVKYSPWLFSPSVSPVLPNSAAKPRPPGANAFVPAPSPAEIEILLKTYWSSIHPHWPILYKPAFDAISIFSISDQVPKSLLYAIYALAARLAPNMSITPEMSEMLVRVVEQEVLQGALRSTIDTCTALFLLSLHYHGEGNQRQAWVLCGLASMMALDLGLHKCTTKLPIDEHERRVRVFWNLFVYEKVLAAEMGRPVTIRMAYCDPTRLSEEQPDEYETVVHPMTGMAVQLHTLSIFNTAIDLFRIFERILSEVHTVPTMATTRSAREKLVHELDHELNMWQASLSPRCAYPKPDDQIPTRTLYLTHAWYLVAIMLLHRPLIPRFRPGHVFKENIHHKKATNAANKLVDLLQQYTIGQDIEKLPPNDAYLIFTAAILHIFNLGLESRAMRDAARPRLEKCLEWLKGLASTWPAASSHRMLLDAFSQAASNTISRTLTPLDVLSPISPLDHHEHTQLTPVDSHPHEQKPFELAHPHPHSHAHNHTHSHTSSSSSSGSFSYVHSANYGSPHAMSPISSSLPSSYERASSAPGPGVPSSYERGVKALSPVSHPSSAPTSGTPSCVATPTPGPMGGHTHQLSHSSASPTTSSPPSSILAPQQAQPRLPSPLAPLQQHQHQEVYGQPYSQGSESHSQTHSAQSEPPPYSHPQSAPGPPHHRASHGQPQVYHDHDSPTFSPNVQHHPSRWQVENQYVSPNQAPYHQPNHPHIPLTSHPNATVSPPGSSQTQSGHDAEQNLHMPELFSLENLYWNDFQTVNMGQVGEIFGNRASAEWVAPSHGSVYHDVLRFLADGPVS